MTREGRLTERPAHGGVRRRRERKVGVIRIREGGPADTPAVLGMLDRAVEWLAAQGRTGQWGERPWSESEKAVAMVEDFLATGDPWIAELDGVPAGTLTLTDGPGSYVAPADEPERYVHLFTTDRRHAGRGVGTALLRHAVEDTRNRGIDLLRVDCYAGGDGKLVAYYESQGFTSVRSSTVGEDAWPGRLLSLRTLAATPPGV